MTPQEIIEEYNKGYFDISYSITVEGRVILLSSPNGTDKNNLFHKLYKDSLDGSNDFKKYDMYWYQDPRFNIDLRWVKKTTIGEEIIEEVHVCKRNVDDSNWDFEEFPKLVADGYKPTSSWFEGMCRQYNNDARKIAQELECLSESTLIKVRDKITGIISEMSILELYKNI